MFHPVYTCHYVDHALQLSGRLDDPAWAKAEVAEFSDIISGEPITFRANARLLYDHEHLYIGFSCEDDYVHATYLERDSPIWQEGCFEAFLCPSGKMRQYYEINVSPLNTVFDTFIINATEETDHPKRRLRSFFQYMCRDLVTKTWVNGELGMPGAQGWSAEYAIPFTSIIGADTLFPEACDAWRMNLCHIASSKQGEPSELSCWATTGHKDFHLPWAFGTLRFSE